MRNTRIVLVGHGDLPAAMLAAAKMIGAEPEGARVLSLFPGESLAAFTNRLCGELGDEVPTLILSDLRGGTPDNASRALASRRPQTQVVANMTLGLVIAVLLDDAELGDRSLIEHCEYASPTTERNVE